VAQFAGGSMAQGSQDSVGCEGHVDLGWLENRDVGLMRRRVIPPTDFNGQPSQAPSPSVSQQPQFSFPDAAQGVIEELSGEALVILFRLSVMFLAVDEFCSSVEWNVMIGLYILLVYCLCKL
jgi:hypothetical protein